MNIIVGAQMSNFQNSSSILLKTRLLRIGGSSWEPKIDQKRREEKLSNNPDDVRTRRSEKKRQEEPSKKIANEMNNDRQ